jgi:hypothetical protein
LRTEAVSLRAELTREVGVTPRIRWAWPGQLDVLVDGAVVFSRRAAGRLPAPGEVARLVKARR